MGLESIEIVRKETPIVHCITNYVTVNDCANMVLACGGSPIMADDQDEAADITSICQATVINIGTLNSRTIESMILAGKKANELKHPVILDPVGVGASKLRTETVFQLLKEVQFSVIRGNSSEIKTIYHGMGTTKGVDADQADEVTTDNLAESVKMVRALSARTKAIIVMTGATDIISDDTTTYLVHNGDLMMSRVTGTGCMLSGVIGAFCGAIKDDILTACKWAVTSMGLCGEEAAKKVLDEGSGTSSFKMYLIDNMSNMNAEQLDRGGRVETFK